MDLQQLGTIIVMTNTHPDIVHTYVSQGLIQYPIVKPQSLIKEVDTQLVYIVGNTSATFILNGDGVPTFTWAYLIFSNSPTQPQTKVITEDLFTQNKFIVIDDNIFDNPDINVVRS